MVARSVPTLKREAYPHDVLFTEVDRIYWLAGRDLVRAVKVLGFCTEGQTRIGFDAESVYYHIHTLLEQGMMVGVMRGSTVKTITLQGSRDPAKVKSTTVWIAPILLYGQKEMTRLIRVHTRKHSAMATVVERFRQELTIDAGTIYVVQVSGDEYDVDWSLTATRREVVEALTVAAHLDSRKVKCQLVDVKSRRKDSVPKPAIKVSEPVTYGQLTLI